jgi:hypothetical protein
MSIEENIGRAVELLEELVTLARSTGGAAVEDTNEEEEVEQPKAGKRGRGRPPKNAEPETEVTLDDVRAELKAYMDTKGTPALKVLLAKYKVKKATDLDEKFYAKIVAEAKKELAEDGNEEEGEDEGEELV